MNDEPKIIPFEMPECPERDTALAMVDWVLETRALWIEAWRQAAVDPEKVAIEEFGGDVNPGGIEAGSCLLKSGERVLARFLVRFDAESGRPVIAANWPREVAEKWAEEA